MSPHPIVHVEFSTNDNEASGKFYSALFGWEIQHFPELNYTMFNPKDGPGGGFSQVSETNPAGSVLVHVETDDIDATLAQVAALGGKILVPKTEIPGQGWFGIFSDPTGNQVGVYTALPAQS
jgi:predicted enzyme related to lactoylglutathione lyase